MSYWHEAAIVLLAAFLSRPVWWVLELAADKLFELVDWLLELGE